MALVVILVDIVFSTLPIHYLGLHYTDMICSNANNYITTVLRSIKVGIIVVFSVVDKKIDRSDFVSIAL